MKINRAINKRLFVSISIILIISGIYLALVHYLISQTASQTPPELSDYLVVLGARLHGERMSLSLVYRVEAALDYLDKNPSTKVIVSGGKGSGEDITEAEAMARFFLSEGINEDRIIMENQSKTTQENLLFSKKYVRDVDSIVIVSNDFHLFRASMIADRVGYEDVHTLAAKTPLVVVTKLWIREYAAVLKTWVFDR